MKWYWCSVGYTPEEALDCEKYKKLPFGCHSCGDWKLMDESEIIKMEKTK